MMPTYLSKPWAPPPHRASPGHGFQQAAAVRASFTCEHLEIEGAL